MKDEQIISLYWKRDEHAIYYTAQKYEDTATRSPFAF